MVMPRAFSSGALSIESNDRNWILGLCFCNTLVMAAVNVVLPWSMWPIVPTFTCGLLRSNFSFAISCRASLLPSLSHSHTAAGTWSATGPIFPQVSYPNPARPHLLEPCFHSLRAERAIDRVLQFLEFFLILNSYGSLLEAPIARILQQEISGAGDGNRTRDQQLGRL